MASIKPHRAYEYDRLLRIHKTLAACQPCNAIDLAEAMEVSARTIKRDIARLRDYFGAPVAWDTFEKSYFYEHPYDLFEHARLTVEEALALVLASKTFASWGGTELARSLEAAMGKLTDCLSDKASLPLSDIAHLVSEPPDCDASSDGLKLFAPLLESIRMGRVVRMAYRKPGEAEVSWRRVHPLHLALLERRWALVALDEGKQEIRKFILSRIQRMDLTEQRFEAPAGFDAREYLRGSFGSFTGNDRFVVQIKFTPELAPYIAERRWHPSQANETQPDGSLTATFTLSSLEDIQRWILSWGSRAQALEPPELVATLQKEIERMQESFSANLNSQI